MTMAANTRTEAQREADLEKIALLLLKGKTQREIAQAIGISRELVKYDVAELRSRWKDSALHNFDESKQLELEKANLVEREAWKGWELSLRDAEKRTVERAGTEDGPVRTRVEQQGQCGNPRFLETALRCVERRCKILGLDAPTKIAPTNPAGDGPANVEVDVKGLSDDELKLLISIGRKMPSRFSVPGEPSRN
jgi:hypothetical protein